METSLANTRSGRSAFLVAVKGNLALLGMLLLLAALPFLIALFDGKPLADVLANRAGSSKFIQGLMIEIFILAIFALSYDLLLGIVGVLSFGHAMFFGVGAYLTGIMLKSFGWDLLPTLGLVLVAGVIQALLFGIVLPRVQGVTFSQVTLGFAAVFHIVIQSNEAMPYTGGDVGLQGLVIPAYLHPSNERLRFYFIALLAMFSIYALYRRFVNSPTGRVCLATRENESRARMLGYNTFYFKLIVLIIASVTAALAGAMHALSAPLISPNVAGLGYTVNALLMSLIGGVGTLSGALVGAAVYRLMYFYLDRWFGENSSFIIGLVYVLIVLFLPYGIVGTWQAKSFQIRQGREWLLRALGVKRKG